MNPERDDNNDRDEVVAAAYRELAQETTPARLDRQVLRQAAEAVRTGQRRGPRWTQPLAWAAMIVVTVTIVLQVSDLPEPPVAGPPPVEAGRKAAPQAPAPGSETARERQAEQRDAAAPPPAAAEPVPTRLEEAANQPAPAGEAAAAVDDADVVSTGAAEAPARERTAAAAGRLPEARSMATAAGMPAGSAEARCDDEARRAPEHWIECIEGLREAGEEAAAAREMTELRAAFPDAELP